MKYAIFSSTCDPLYEFSLPIVAWCWRKLGYLPIVCVPRVLTKTLAFALQETIKEDGLGLALDAPEHKLATYAQNARLYGAALNVVKDQDLIVTTDADMLVFRDEFHETSNFMNILGADLVPTGQYPMCYAYGLAATWKEAFQLKVGDTPQTLLDARFKEDECEHYRGNRWSADQEALYNALAFGRVNVALHNRAYPGTQFASRRIDRADGMWETMLKSDTIDCHLWRPGYTPENFSKIMRVLRCFYPTEDFSWLLKYIEQYISI